jgi:fructosamine-3-kinase
MRVPQEVKAWCHQSGHGEVVRVDAVAGGCINQGCRLHTSDGATFFLKVNERTPPDMFPCEAAGLRALAVPEGPRVPEVHLFGPTFILLEDLRPAAPQPDYWEEFGRRLAGLHNHVNERFGFESDNYIGSTPQPNPWTEDGYAFFAEHRLVFQARMAFKRGLIEKQDHAAVERLAGALPQLIPDQPASLIHGDLWSGNALTGPHGEPAMIDPAAHYGWAEAELAMTALFGAFPAAFYQAYEETRPLPPGWRDRFPIYNLYHLLNHVNLFGGGYLGQVRAILGRYA